MTTKEVARDIVRRNKWYPMTPQGDERFRTTILERYDREKVAEIANFDSEERKRCLQNWDL